MENQTQAKLDADKVERIRFLANRFRGAQIRGQDLIEESLRIAWELGDELQFAQSKVEQAEFDSLLSAIRIDRNAAKRLVRFRSANPELVQGQANRQGMLALGFAPAKQTKDDGDKKVSMLPHLSASVAAWARYVRAVQLGHLDVDEAEVRRETAEMFIWLRKFHEPKF
jgi:hypothetical protein